MSAGSWRVTRALVLLVALSVLVVPTALGGAAQSADSIYQMPDIGSGAMTNETPSAWFVETKGSLQAFRDQASRVGASYSERFSYTKVWNGLSIRTGSKDLGLLTRLPSVKAVYPVFTAKIPETSTISPELATAVNMTGAAAAQSELGLTGTGVKVAVMDTGIDYDHPDLGGCFGPSCRVMVGHDFVGDDYDEVTNPNPIPDNDPDDCNGHGTHVAGIVGAKAAGASGVTGVAPGVRFGAYRVFGCVGSTSADIMLAAMERALNDDMDILNMSIGSAFNTWPQYPTAVGADALVDAGVIVVTSIGNSGANGVYSASAPGVGNKVIGTASFENSHVSALTFRINPGNEQVAYLQLADTTPAPTSGTTPDVVYVGRGCPGAALAPPGPDDPYLANPAGKVALIDRGACTFDSKYQRAFNAGAVAVVIANNVPGIFAGGSVVDRGIPGVGIAQADGNLLKTKIAAGATTLTWTNTRILAVNPVGGTASSFTSFGLTAELKVKPNIGAPGGLIRSTYPLENGDETGYAIISGTSMASPHVAGAVALLLQAKPGTTAARAKQLFQNSADPVTLAPPNTAFLDPVHRQGAGMIDIDDAIKATASVSPSEVALGEGTGGTFTLTITNNGASAVTYTLANQNAVATGGATNAPSILVGNQTVTFSSPTVAVPAGGSASFNVTVTQALSQGRQYGGYVRMTGSDGSVLRVPYAGFSGDYQAIQVLVPTANNFPRLGREVSPGLFSLVPAGSVFSMVGLDVPNFLVHMEHQARMLEFELYSARTGRPAGGLALDSTFLRDEYLPRNSTATSFFAFAFDGRLPVRGTDASMPVANGTYFVKLKVLKALGDPSNPAHTETWTSPTFVIQRG
jgi:subtilisin family serine protease